MRGTGETAGSGAVDNASLRRSNLALVLRQLREQGPRSRARLATELGLTRSAASSLVGELAERGLVRSGSVERGGPGRPGTAVEVDGHAVCGIGAEINVNHIATMALDLGGRVVAEQRLSLEVHRLEVGEVLDRLSALVDRTVEEVTARGATTVGMVLGVAGLVDRSRESLVVAPNLGWRDVPVAARVRDLLGPGFPVLVDNEANLAAIAEAVPGDARRQDILVISGEVGLGGGIIAGGRLLHGAEGYAGEFGHMIVDPQGRLCGCGRTGCWETVAGLRALLDWAADADDPVRDPALTLEARLAEINRRADLGDTRTLAALEQVGGWLGAGAAMLANALNPAAIVLSGYFAEVGRHLQQVVRERLEAGVLAPRSGGTTVELSTFGSSAVVRGGATVALDAVFADPTLVERRPSVVAGGTR